MKMKRTLLLWFFILAGIVLGAMLASVCRNVPFLSWLSYYQSIGFNSDAPFVLDLSVVKLTVRLFHGRERGADIHHCRSHFSVQPHFAALRRA